MRVLVPFTRIQVVTRVSLIPYRWEGVEIGVDTPSYIDFFRQRWCEGEPFINVEHDVGFWHGAIESLEDCPHPWCGFGYEKGPLDMQLPFGLVKFSAEIIEATQDVWDDWPNPHWGYCDSWFWDYTKVRGLRPHRHEPPVINANPARLGAI